MDSTRRKRRCEPECKEHIFWMHPFNAKSVNASKFEIRICFCPKYQRQPIPPEPTHPLYIYDGKYYTPAFVLGVDRRTLKKNEQQELMDHQKQIRESLEKNNQFQFPRPNSKHSHCSVCKEQYKNYYAHIASADHRERIHANLYNAHITELASRYADLWVGAEQDADDREDQLLKVFGQPARSVTLENQDEQASSEGLSDFFQQHDPLPQPAVTEVVAPKRAAPAPVFHEDTKRKVSKTEPTQPKPKAISSEKDKAQKREHSSSRDKTVRHEDDKDNEEHEEHSNALTEKYTAVKPHGEFIWQRERKPIKPIVIPTPTVKCKDYYEPLRYAMPYDPYPPYEDKPKEPYKYEKAPYDKPAEVVHFEKAEPHYKKNDQRYDKHEGYDKHKEMYEKHREVYEKHRESYHEAYKKDEHYGKHYYEKEKKEYNSMYYQEPWQMPYYMPPYLPPEGKHPYMPSNTNININFPMYMPYHSMYNSLPPQGYSLMPTPYMGYQYPVLPDAKKKDYHPHK